MEISNLFSISQKNAVITGGSSGIGRMIAEGFVKNGATVFIISRKADMCEKTAKELNQLGTGKCIPIPGDLSTELGCQNVVAKIASKTSTIHILINNSGTAWGDRIEDYPDKGLQALDKVYALNVKTVLFMTRELLPLLDAAATETDPARVINVGSIQGIEPSILNTIGYDVSKAAVHHMTRVLSAKLCRRPNGRKICFNCIAPGFVLTNMTKDLGDAMETIKSITPLERFGTSEDLVGITIFLSSKASAWMTGVILPIDGGMLSQSHL